MSVVFLVGSEDQLRNGTPWLKRFADVSGMSLHVAIVGLDRNILRKHAESTLSNQLDQSTNKVSFAMVPAEADAVLEFTKSVGCRTLLMLHSADGAALQQTVFEKSPIEVVWLRSGNDPPQRREQVFCALAETQTVAVNTSEKLLGLIPHDVLRVDPIVQNGVAEQGSHPIPVVDHVKAAVDQMTATEMASGDLILVGVLDPTKNNPAYMFGRNLIESPVNVTVALISDGDTISQSLSRKLSKRIQTWVASVAPPMEREERVQLVESLELGSKPNLEFLGLISAAAMLAAFGLLQDSAAVIIGAMLIAPLMTPILGAGLSLTHGNRPLFRSSMLTITLGFFGALTASILFGWLVIMVWPTADKIDLITPEMWARCRPSPLDFCVGLVGGIAAAYAQTRRHLSAALAGAAIAAALVPPLSTAGLQIAFGIWGDREGVPPGVLPVIGPLLLVTINVLMIMLGASFVLWARGMRTDHHKSAKSKWVLRVIAVLLILAAMILVTEIGPEMIFPAAE